MISFGDKKISGAYVGDKQIHKIYLNDKVIFPALLTLSTQKVEDSATITLTGLTSNYSNAGSGIKITFNQMTVGSESPKKLGDLIQELKSSEIVIPRAELKDGYTSKTFSGANGISVKVQLQNSKSLVATLTPATRNEQYTVTENQTSVVTKFRATALAKVVNIYGEEEGFEKQIGSNGAFNTGAEALADIKKRADDWFLTLGFGMPEESGYKIKISNIRYTEQKVEEIKPVQVTKTRTLYAKPQIIKIETF